MTEWTDLDQAYLDIFGEHPTLSAPGGKVIPMDTRRDNADVDEET